MGCKLGVNAKPQPWVEGKYRETTIDDSCTPQVCSDSGMHSARADVITPRPDRVRSESPNLSFCTTDLNGSFHNSSFILENGDCRVDKAGFMRSSYDDKRHAKPSYKVSISSHTSDDQLVLACMDCGAEICSDTTGQVCPLTGKLHV